MKVSYLGQDKSMDINPGMKGFVKILYKNNVINSDVQLDSANVQLVCEKYGNDISPNWSK